MTKLINLTSDNLIITDINGESTVLPPMKVIDYKECELYIIERDGQRWIVNHSEGSGKDIIIYKKGEDIAIYGLF